MDVMLDPVQNQDHDQDQNQDSLKFNENTRFIVSSDQLVSLSQADLNLPLEVCQGFWTVNTYNQRLITPSDRLFISYFPLLIGPCCTPIRLRDFLRIFKMFTFWLILGQIAYYLYLIMITNTPTDIFTVDRYILEEYGILHPSRIKYKHEYWRIFSAILIHNCAQQLVINFFLEMIFVLPREACWKTYRLVPIFILSSICGNFTNLCFKPNGKSTGPASAIFGVFGAFVSSYLVVVRKLSWKHCIGVLVMICFIIALLIVAGTQEASENIGLAGGFIYGIFIGLAIFSKNSDDKKRTTACLIIGIVGSVVLIVFPIICFLFEIRVKKE